MTQAARGGRKEVNMNINVHAGHNPDGKTACGAVGFLKESTEARSVKNKVIALLRAQGHTVHDCTVDNGASQADVLYKIAAKCNAHAADLDVSIHFNSGSGDNNGNGITTGTEAFVYSSASRAKPYAQNIVNAISALGFKNRGVKYSSSLYVLRKTKAPALLVECCFVDDKDDAELYNRDKMAAAIVKGITGWAYAGQTETYKAGTWYQATDDMPVRNGYYGESGRYEYLSADFKKICRNKGGYGHLKAGTIICPTEVKRYEDGSVWFKLDGTITILAVEPSGTACVKKA